MTPPTKRRRALPAEPSVSAEFVERMSEKYADSLPRATIAEEIHAALSHKNAKKWTNTELYVQRWLNREVERHQANAQAPPSQNRRRPTQQSPPKDPRSSLQGPYSHLIKH
ncbi:MAG: hypothetical protein HY689_02890 [Chloroflexi bacterium]|nr:hypothetical protein [Chloroflexota bacterium]